MAQQTAMQTLIAWGDAMLLKHPQKILSFGEAIDKAVELLQMEKEQIINARRNGFEKSHQRFNFQEWEGLDEQINLELNSEEYYNQTYTQSGTE